MGRNRCTSDIAGGGSNNSNRSLGAYRCRQQWARYPLPSPLRNPVASSGESDDSQTRVSDSGCSSTELLI